MAIVFLYGHWKCAPTQSYMRPIAVSVCFCPVVAALAIYWAYESVENGLPDARQGMGIRHRRAGNIVAATQRIRLIAWLAMAAGPFLEFGWLAIHSFAAVAYNDNLRYPGVPLLPCIGAALALPDVLKDK